MTSAIKQPETLHGTAVLLPQGMPLAGMPARTDTGVLLRGASGAGKSDLALRLIGRGARLVADDRVVVTDAADGPVCSAPENLHGLIEVRGIGLLRLPASAAPLSLVIDLVPRDAVPRLPDARTTDIDGHAVPVFALHAFDAATPDKILAAAQGSFCP